MRSYPLLLVLAGLVCLMPCARAQEGGMDGGEASESRPATDEQKNRLGALLPAPAEVGATADGDRVFYTGDLFDYIDGAAPAYFDFGFQCLAHQGYKAGGIELKADGTPVTGEIVVQNQTAGQAVPAIAMAANGEFVVAWYEDRVDIGDVQARRFNVNGTPNGAAFNVAVGAGEQSFPNIATDGAGRSGRCPSEGTRSSAARSAR